MRAELRGGVLWLALGLGALGCTPKPPALAGSAASLGSSSVERYLPLRDNTVFSYETFIEETNEHGLAIIEVSRPRAELAELRVAGRVKKRYYIQADGVENAEGGYLLKSPLAENAEWQGDSGKVKLTQVNESIRVPAGAFEGCIRTVETSNPSSASRTITTVFCPGVGMVYYQLEGDVDGQPVLDRLSLKSFGPRFGASAP